MQTVAFVERRRIVMSAPRMELQPSLIRQTVIGGDVTWECVGNELVQWNLAAYRHMNLSKGTLECILNTSWFSTSRKATLDVAVFRVGSCLTDRAVTFGWTRSMLDRGPQSFRRYSQILIISCSLVIPHRLYRSFHFTSQNIRDSLVSIYFSSGSTTRCSGWLNVSYIPLIWFSQIFRTSLIWYYVAFRVQGYINMRKVVPLQILPIVLQINSGMIKNSPSTAVAIFIYSK